MVIAFCRKPLAGSLMISTKSLAPIIQRKLHFPCAGYASYPFVDLPPMNDCKQSFTVSKFYTFPI